MSSGLKGAKHEHYPVLRQLLVDALVQRRYSEAEKIYVLLERTQFIDRDPQFMFKVQRRVVSTNNVPVSHTSLP